MVAIFGPTGVGKTAVAIALADGLRARGEDPVAVSADALQLYRGLEILTGAADAEERARLEHRLLGIAHVTESFSAGRYAELAHATIDGLLGEGRRPIVVGGTGLYLRAALAELDLRPPPDPELRERWTAALARNGPDALHDVLRRRAPEAAAAITRGDGHRLIRALELLDAGHEPPQRAEGTSELWTSDTRHPTLLAALTMDRERLYARIDARVDAMVEAGAAAEVKRAELEGASQTARAALGYTQLLDGDIDGMKMATRRYARRQLTWLRKLPEPDVLRIDTTDRTAADVAGTILAALP
jgi:tRNA dimethylallyltransferase